MTVTAQTDAERVLDRHKQLQAEHEAAGLAYGRGSREREQLERRLRVADSARAAAYEHAATQGTPEAQAIVDEAEGEHGRLVVALEKNERAVEAAYRARQRVESQVEALYERHLDVFIAVAEEYAELAETKRRAFEPAARGWYAADGVARAAWRPLERALMLLAEGADRDAGELHDRSHSYAVAQVPPLPDHLASADTLLAALPASRPPLLERMVTDE